MVIRIGSVLGVAFALIVAFQFFPAAAEADERTQTANILGFFRDDLDKRGDAELANQHVSLANTYNPLVMSYQEVCLSQYNVLKSILGGAGVDGKIH